MPLPFLRVLFSTFSVWPSAHRVFIIMRDYITGNAVRERISGLWNLKIAGELPWLPLSGRITSLRPSVGITISNIIPQKLWDVNEFFLAL